MPNRLTILHTNDIHGRLEGLARVATLVAQTRANSQHPVLYFDAGDIEETNTRLSSLTKGVAMHQLLSAAGCQAAAIGNGGLLRYSQSILEQYAKAASYPLFLANVVMPDGASVTGVQPSGILEVNGVKLGIIGLTDPFEAYTSFFGLRQLEIVAVVRQYALALRAQGADLIVVLSHLGWLHKDAAHFNDQHLAQALPNEIDLIIGAHTHHLLEHGERIGRVWVAQAGNYAEHLGRIECEANNGLWQVVSCSVQAITDEIQPAQAVLEKVSQINAELETWLNEPLCQLTADFSYHELNESAVGSLLADALRDYWNADVGVAMAGIGFEKPLLQGVLTRATLKDITIAANPAVCQLSGLELLELLERGQNPEQINTRELRGGMAFGTLHVSGVKRENQVWLFDNQPLEPLRIYRVAATDAELESSFGYLSKEQSLKVQYHSDIIVNEVLEQYVQKYPQLSPAVPRIL